MDYEALARDVPILLREGFGQFAHGDTWRELPRWLWHMAVGAPARPKEEDFIYTDLHVHIHAEQGMRQLLKEASKRVDVMSLVTRDCDSTAPPPI